MSLWTMIAVIVIACVVGEVFRKRYEAQASTANNEDLDKLNARIDQLESSLRERIEVLERIVTDDKADLKRQFDYLDKAS